MVYLIFQNVPYEGSYFYGSYSTRELAEEAVRKLSIPLSGSIFAGEFSIFESTLDAPPAYQNLWGRQ